MPNPGIFNPMFDVTETTDAFIIQAAVPGVSEKDLNISLTSNRLIVSGKREAEEAVRRETQSRAERSWGAFSRCFNRTFALPQGTDLDRVNAELKQGVLTVTVPRMKEAPLRKITVKSAGAKS